MSQELFEILPEYTARITLPEQGKAGTGCFVAPGVLLTCAHVVTAALATATTSTIEVCWQEHYYPSQLLKQSTEYDLALLHVPLANHPCVLLQDKVEPHDRLLSYGYPDDYPQGDTITGELEGLTQDRCPLLKFKMGQVRPGMSGAPLFNERNGTVCGIVKRSRARESDLGGRAIPTCIVLQVFPELIEGQRLYQRSDLGWTQWEQMHPLLSHVNRNRRLMLERVRKKWIKGVLEPSLHEAPLILLGLQEQPSLVENAWREEIQDFEQMPHPLRAGTRLIEAYENADRALLLLGAPGAGKTTLLLDITADLLVRAERDEMQPIPVIFHLASWAMKRQPLEAWLAEELFIKYQVPRAVGQEWMEREELAIMLDGLDEVAAEHRAACVEAINNYRQAHGFVPLIVSSRSREYTSLPCCLRLGGAVIVQPLTSAQIEEYLKRTSETFAPVRKVLEEDEALRELASTPLILSVLSVTYTDRPLEGLVKANEDVETRRRQIFATYIQQMLRRRGNKPPYPPQQTIGWLVWLAQHLSQRHLSEFYLERMQPDWLPDKRWWQSGYHIGIRICLILLCMVFGGLAASVGKTLQSVYLMKVSYPDYMSNFGSVISAISLAGLGLGLAFGLLTQIKATIQPAEVITWSWKRLWQQPENIAMLRNALIGTLVMAPLLVLHEWSHIPRPGELYFLYDELFYGYLFGLFFGLLVGMASQIMRGMLRIYDVGPPQYEDRRAITMVVLRSLLIWVGVGLLYGLLFWKLSWTQWNGRSIQLGGGFFGALAGIMSGLSSKVLRAQAVVGPLQREKNVLPFLVAVSLLVGFMTGGTMNIFLWWIVPWWHTPPWNLPYTPFFLSWLLISLVCGLAFALLYQYIPHGQSNQLRIGLAFGCFNGFIGILSYWFLFWWLSPHVNTTIVANVLTSICIGVLFGSLGGLLAYRLFCLIMERQGVPASLFFGLPVGILSGLIIGFTWTPHNWIPRMLVWGSLAWLLSSFLLGLLHRGVGLSLSWKQVLRNVVTSETLRNMLSIWVITSILGVWLWKTGTWNTRLHTALIIGTIGGLSFGFLGTLLSGFSSEKLDEHTLTIPNQGIRHSARNSLQVGLFFGLVIGLISGLISWPQYMWELRPDKAIAMALFCLGIIGLLGGLMAALMHGGLACIQHGVLRVMLAYLKATPWHYSRYLDYVAELILLRKIGGGYIFVHRILQEYLASLDMQSALVQISEHAQGRDYS